MIVLYPEALNQHPIDAIDVLRAFFMFGILIGFVVYLFALWALLVGTLIRRRRTTLDRQTVQSTLRATVPIGAAFALFVPILAIRGIINGTAGDVVTISVMIGTFAAAVLLTRFILRRNRLNVPRPFSDAWWFLILTVPLLIGMAASASSAYKNGEIAIRQKTTDGIVTDFEPSNYNLCRFTFSFLGRTYEGAGRPLIGTATVGQHLIVFFDPNHPQTNSLEDFARLSRRQKGFVPLCLVAIFGVVGLVVYARQRQSRTANQLLSA